MPIPNKPGWWELIACGPRFVCYSPGGDLQWLNMMRCWVKLKKTTDKWSPKWGNFITAPNNSLPETCRKNGVSPDYLVKVREFISMEETQSKALFSLIGKF